MQPMAAITKKSFSESILLHTAEDIKTIISTSPGIQYELYVDVILPCNYMNLVRKHHN